MLFDQFENNVSLIKNASLGGVKAQNLMVPKMRKKYTTEIIKDSNPRKASVLALFYPDLDNQTRFLLTLRASYNGTHSSQVSFPGGKREESDENSEYTAKRETFEEVGVNTKEIEIIKSLTKAYIPPSNFLVTPFIGLTTNTPRFEINSEVEEIIEVKLSDLLDDSNVIIRNMSTSYMKNIDVSCFKLNNYVVWGATAMILSEIKCLFKTI